MIKKNYSFFSVMCLLLLFGVIGCTKDSSGTDNSVASCEGCHTNYAHLQQVYSPDTSAPVGGCGGEAPHYEPYDRVYMGGDGLELYKKSSHYSIGCIGCHNGTDNTDDKLVAHSGDFISHPSSEADTKCASCHAQIVEKSHTSLHNGTGQKTESHHPQRAKRTRGF